MIQNNSLKIAIVNSFKTTTLTDSVDIIATEVILYKFLLSLIKTNSVNNNDINTLVGNYKSKYEFSFISLKNTYNSYQKIYIFLKNNSTNNLLGLSENDIDTVYEYYLDSSKIIKFNNNSFNNMMYGVNKISSGTANYLRKIHFEKICKIIEYYNTVYGIPIENMKIVSCDTLPNNIGKRIDFTITGISPFLVIRDIENKKIDISYYSIHCEYPNIVLINE